MHPSAFITTKAPTFVPKWTELGIVVSEVAGLGRATWGVCLGEFGIPRRA